MRHGGVDWPGKFCVYQQWKAGPRHARQCRSEIILADHGEAIDSGMNQKALESPHSRAGKLFDVCLVALDYATPRRQINPAIVLAAWGLRRNGTTRIRYRRHVRGT